MATGVSSHSIHQHQNSSAYQVTGAQDELTERIDWVIQESALEGMHRWASAVFAHSSYFSKFDLIMFLVNKLNEGLTEGLDEDGGRQAEGGETKDGADEGTEQDEEVVEEAKATAQESGGPVGDLVMA